MVVLANKFSLEKLQFWFFSNLNLLIYQYYCFHQNYVHKYKLSDIINFNMTPINNILRIAYTYTSLYKERDDNLNTLQKSP